MIWQCLRFSQSCTHGKPWFAIMVKSESVCGSCRSVPLMAVLFSAPKRLASAEGSLARGKHCYWHSGLKIQHICPKVRLWNCVCMYTLHAHIAHLGASSLQYLFYTSELQTSNINMRTELEEMGDWELVQTTEGTHTKTTTMWFLGWQLICLMELEPEGPKMVWFGSFPPPTQVER